MFTKECNSNKYCLFYVSEFHLEMILLPYIKEKIDKMDIKIYTEDNLTEGIKLLLDRTNFTKEDKNKILKLNWDNKQLGNDIKVTKDNSVIIINGSINYMEQIEKRLPKLSNIEIVHCYDICKNNFNIDDIKQKYKGILNTGNNFPK